MRAMLTGLALALLATAQPADAKNENLPDIRRCPLKRLTGDEGTGRTRAIPVPRPYDLFMRSNRDNFAVRSWNGRTICIDASWMSQIRDISLSGDGRFLSFGWDGYEAFGNIVVDRSGDGQFVDTGAAPVFSPAREQMAAVDFTDSAFGALNAFAVWRIEPQGLRQVAKVENLPAMEDWRIDNWQGENCINLSAVPHDRIPENYSDLPKARRDRFAARPSGQTWRVTRSATGCAIR